MKQVLSYNIHDVLRFQIHRDRGLDRWDLVDLKFAPFRTESVDSPDIVLNIGKFAPSNAGCYVIDHNYHVRDNYFYCRDSEGKASWEAEVAGFDHGDTTINFNPSVRLSMQPTSLLYTPLFLPQALLLRIIESRLIGKGRFLAHAGAVARNGQAYVLSGRAGCFKTTLCMEFVRAGFTWLGDDRVILGGDEVMGFPMNPAMFAFMLRHLRDETQWGLLRQLQFYAQCVAGGGGRQGRTAAESARLKAVLLIAKSAGSDREVTFSAVPQSRLDQTVERLVVSARLEDFKGLAHFGIRSGPFLKYMLAYAYVFPNSFVATQEREAAESLKNALRDVPVYEVLIPRKWGRHVFEKVHDFVDRECGS